jgi:hypothetical protein
LNYNISQDGAGFMLNEQHSQIGFYSSGIETCSAYIFYGPIGIVLIHDSGQTTLESIIALASRCGPLESVYYALNPTYASITEYKPKFDNHQQRRDQISSAMGLHENMQALSVAQGAILVRHDKILTRFLPGNDLDLIKSPHHEQREMINMLNNLFVDNGAQSIPLDIQFDTEVFTTLPKLIKTKKQIQQIATEQEATSHNMGYVKLLATAERLGILL